MVNGGTNARHRKRLVAACALSLLLLSVPTLAQNSEPDAKRVLRQLLSRGAEAVTYTERFEGAVRSQQLSSILSSLEDSLGSFKAVEGEASPYTLRFANGTARAEIVVDKEARIAGLRFSNVTRETATLDAAVEGLLALPGTISLTILEEGAPLLSAGSSEPLAVGSAFKLAVLRALEDAIGEGTTSWQRVLQLPEGRRSLPSGISQNWPVGSRVTTETAAILMISLSDNTATDLLIRHLGREAVEEYAPNSRPLLTTREFFLLKAPGQAEMRQRYLQAPVSERRRLLESGIGSELPEESLFAGGPVHPEIEWFFTTEELAELIGEIDSRPLLSISPGPFDPSGWSYLGYKGGSEPGVLNMTLLLVSKAGTEYSLSATQNRADAAVDPGPFISAINSILYHLSRDTES